MVEPRRYGETPEFRTVREYKQRLIEWLKLQVAHGLMSSVASNDYGEAGFYWVNKRGMTADLPFIDVVFQPIEQWEEALEAARQAIYTEPEMRERRRLHEATARQQRQAALAQATARPPEAEQEIPPMPGVEKPFKEAISGLPYSAQAYFGQRLGGIYGEFEEEQPGAQEAWWRTLNIGAGQGEDREDWMAHLRETSDYLAQRVQGGLAPETREADIRSAGRIRRMLIEAEMGAEAEIAEEWATGERMRYPGGDVVIGTTEAEPTKPVRAPWEMYLEEKPFMAEFLTVPKRQRGFFPARFAPSTRWV